MHINTLTEAEQLLARYMPQVKELLGKDLTLERMQPLMQILDHPENKVKIVHVAGTSGKTSTCYYIASLLKTAGLKVGLTVSPHVDSITERVQIDLQQLSEREFCDSIAEFLELIQTVQPQPTYFELLIAFVYWYFAKTGVDYAVIETGLGGSFDATNITKSSQKVCVITDIGLDHIHVLGSDLLSIATQKAGIIHYGNHVFMYDQPEVNTVFENAVQHQGAVLHFLNQTEEQKTANESQLNNLPLYQQRNWLLAHHVYDFLAQRDNLAKLTDEELASSMKVQIPGRMDVRTINSKTLIMDGAHNQQKMRAFVSSFQAMYPDRQAAILLSSKNTKDYGAILPYLLPICSTLIITTFHTNQDMPAISLAANELAAAAGTAGFKNIQAIPDSTEAYKALLNCTEDLLVVTGSFYLLSVLRPIILTS